MDHFRVGFGYFHDYFRLSRNLHLLEVVPREGDQTSSLPNYSEIRSLTRTNKPSQFVEVEDRRGERDAEEGQQDIVK